ncbi:MAG: peptidoglycan DD-metalloendopeptidase family protein [Pseudomonadota bacterium]
MRSALQATRVRTLLQASALTVLAGVVTGCSNDANRFDQVLTTATTLTPNQNAIIRQRGPVEQAYPGDVDGQTTSSVTTTRSGVQVVQRNNAAPAYRQPSRLAPRVESAPLAPLKPSAPKVVQRATGNTAYTSEINDARETVSDAPAFKPIAKAAPLRVMGTDGTVTGSVRPAAQTPAKAVSAIPAQTRNQSVSREGAGWTKTGGTWVQLKSGETLYNLSRRFGVPVTAITKANNISDPSTVAAGSRILIPTYQYGSSVPVSAPDNHPISKASRASRGFQGQAHGRVGVPKSRIQQPQPILQAQGEPNGSTHLVEKGDTLSSISRRYGVSMSALRTANNLTGDTVRLGARLAIPAKGQVVASADKSLDPVTTSSVPTQSKVTSRRETPSASKPIYTTPAESVDSVQKRTNTASKPVKTANAGSSAAAFRWPAQGRVVSRFGERTPNGANDGIDISVPVGTPVKAADSGTVIYSGSELEDFGKLILVSHNNGWVSAYAHSSENLVSRGDKVRRGQVIAKSGRSGNATAPKLHFELRKNSNPVNPLSHLSSN